MYVTKTMYNLWDGWSKIDEVVPLEILVDPLPCGRSSVGGVEYSRTGGRRSDLRLSQFLFAG